MGRLGSCSVAASCLTTSSSRSLPESDSMTATDVSEAGDSTGIKTLTRSLPSSRRVDIRNLQGLNVRRLAFDHDLVRERGGETLRRRSCDLRLEFLNLPLHLLWCLSGHDCRDGVRAHDALCLLHRAPHGIQRLSRIHSVLLEGRPENVNRSYDAPKLFRSNAICKARRERGTYDCETIFR